MQPISLLADSPMYQLQSPTLAHFHVIVFTKCPYHLPSGVTTNTHSFYHHRVKKGYAIGFDLSYR